MSGSLIQLAAKGAQDAYITSSAGMSLFRTKYTRHKNFSQAAKLIKIITNKDSTVIPFIGNAGQFSNMHDKN